MLMTMHAKVRARLSAGPTGGGGVHRPIGSCERDPWTNSLQKSFRVSIGGPGQFFDEIPETKSLVIQSLECHAMRKISHTYRSEGF
jgi:hypothetical protein